jgi:hypothetical protein
MLSSQTIDALLLTLGGVALVLIVVVVLLALRLRRLAADQRLAFEGVEVDVLAAIARHAKRLEELGVELDAARRHTATVESDGRHALSRVGVVRYDALDEMGGKLSFSAALLDEHGDGVVITSISARGGSRTYLKAVTDGETESLLSAEERTAVDAARAEQRSERDVTPHKRSWRER